MLGHGRFLALTLVACATAALAVHLTPGANGASMVIWACGPPLWFATRADRSAEADTPNPERERITAILILVYAILPLGMTAAPYLSGWRGNPAVAFLSANTYHLVATGVGVIWAAAMTRTRSFR